MISPAQVDPEAPDVADEASPAADSTGRTKLLTGDVSKDINPIKSPKVNTGDRFGSTVALDRTIEAILSAVAVWTGRTEKSMEPWKERLRALPQIRRLAQSADEPVVHLVNRRSGAEDARSAPPMDFARSDSAFAGHVAIDISDVPPDIGDAALVLRNEYISTVRDESAMDRWLGRCRKVFARHIKSASEVRVRHIDLAILLLRELQRTNAWDQYVTKASFALTAAHLVARQNLGNIAETDLETMLDWIGTNGPLAGLLSHERSSVELLQLRAMLARLAAVQLGEWLKVHVDGERADGSEALDSHRITVSILQAANNYVASSATLARRVNSSPRGTRLTAPTFFRLVVAAGAFRPDLDRAIGETLAAIRQPGTFIVEARALLQLPPSQEPDSKALPPIFGQLAQAANVSSVLPVDDYFELHYIELLACIPRFLGKERTRAASTFFNAAISLLRVGQLPENKGGTRENALRLSRMTWNLVGFLWALELNQESLADAMISGDGIDCVVNCVGAAAEDATHWPDGIRAAREFGRAALHAANFLTIPVPPADIARLESSTRSADLASSLPGSEIDIRVGLVNMARNLLHNTIERFFGIARRESLVPSEQRDPIVWTSETREIATIRLIRHVSSDLARLLGRSMEETAGAVAKMMEDLNIPPIEALATTYVQDHNKELQRPLVVEVGGMSKEEFKELETRLNANAEKLREPDAAPPFDGVFTLR